MIKISQNFNKIGFMPYLTTLSIKKKQTFLQKPKVVKDRKGGRSRVGMTAVKDSMVFF